VTLRVSFGFAGGARHARRYNRNSGATDFSFEQLGTEVNI
jgi:hypothetical protein